MPSLSLFTRRGGRTGSKAAAVPGGATRQAEAGPGNYSVSDRIGRLMSSRTASLAGTPAYNTRKTPIAERHLYRRADRDCADCFRCGVAFNDLADFRERSLGRGACCEQQAEAPVARLVVGAGENEIAESGETHERLALGAERHAESHHLRQPASDQSDTGVSPKAEAV